MSCDKTDKNLFRTRVLGQSPSKDTERPAPVIVGAIQRARGPAPQKVAVAETGA